MTNRPFSEHIVNIPLYQFPLSTIDWNRKVSENFSLREYYNATFVTPLERKSLAGLPLDERLIEAIQLIRNYLGKPLTITSLFRSIAWNNSQGRFYVSQHEYAMAADLKGQGLKDVIYNAIKTKNQLYRDLKRLNIFSFGFYNWGVHIDTRDVKSDGTDRIWFKDVDESKYPLIQEKKK